MFQASRPPKRISLCHSNSNSPHKLRNPVEYITILPTLKDKRPRLLPPDKPKKLQDRTARAYRQLISPYKHAYLPSSGKTNMQDRAAHAYRQPQKLVQNMRTRHQATQGGCRVFKAALCCACLLTAWDQVLSRNRLHRSHSKAGANSQATNMRKACQNEAAIRQSVPLRRDWTAALGGRALL